jgi:putative acetyltransferase
MLIRRETAGDIDEVREVVTAAFRVTPGVVPGESILVDELRTSPDWIPELSFVALGVTGHVVCTRARLGGRPALGLGPLSVHPDAQRRGVGKALVHAVLGAADALGEPIVVLLGDPGYYARFGFVLASELGITPPVPEWAPHFQARPLTTYEPTLRGPFTYPAAFARVS